MKEDIWKVPYWTRRRKILLAAATFYFVLGAVFGITIAGVVL